MATDAAWAADLLKAAVRVGLVRDAPYTTGDVAWLVRLAHYPAHPVLPFLRLCLTRLARGAPVGAPLADGKHGVIHAVPGAPDRVQKRQPVDSRQPLVETLIHLALATHPIDAVRNAVPRLHSVAWTNDDAAVPTLVVTMDHAGEALDQFIDRTWPSHGAKRVPRDVVVNYFVSAARLLDTLQNSVGFEHGDMTACNIMVTAVLKSARLCLVDFGSSTVALPAGFVRPGRVFVTAKSGKSVTTASARGQPATDPAVDLATLATQMAVYHDGQLSVEAAAVLYDLRGAAHVNAVVARATARKLAPADSWWAAQERSIYLALRRATPRLPSEPAAVLATFVSDSIEMQQQQQQQPSKMGAHVPSLKRSTSLIECADTVRTVRQRTCTPVEAVGSDAVN